jgi:hypothetical protein
MSEFSAEEVNDGSTIMKGTAADKAADYANYFCSYSYLYHQKQMLMDHVRMRAYHSAIMNNKSLFEGKTVLDVGTGSGVLSIWAAQAGAVRLLYILRLLPSCHCPFVSSALPFVLFVFFVIVTFRPRCMPLSSQTWPSTPATWWRRTACPA